MIYVENNTGDITKCRALLDTCATANFISDSIVRRLRLSVRKQTTTISMINSLRTESRGIVEITTRSTCNEFTKELTCIVIPTIINSMPSEIISRRNINIPPNIKLADPKFHMPRAIDLLIGSGATLALFSVGQINLSVPGHELYLQKTRLGWIIAGSVALSTSSDNNACHVVKLERQLERFWAVESVADNVTMGDTECEQHVLNTVTRNSHGQYIVRLPFKTTNTQLGESRNTALRRLVALERRFRTSVNLENEYNRIIREYCERKYLTVLDHVDDNGYYMPHHAVVKESSNTTKIRVVFDASAKTNTGVSLNDLLLIGPTIQDKLFAHLIRFRTYRYVMTADIEKMYLQVLVHEQDRRYQRILWRVDGIIKTLQCNTLTFGVASSPFLAVRVIRKLADDERNSYPVASRILQTHLYVDNLLAGADSINEARAIRDEIIELLRLGGFAMRQWASNDERVTSGLTDTALHACYTIGKEQHLTTLGVTWQAREDKIRYDVRKINLTDKITKRNILSEIAKIYDPLGLLGPVVLYAKTLMQNVWRCGLEWDESVPQDIHSAWTSFRQQLDLINQIAFERKFSLDESHDIQLHGFCDASAVGYGACIYARSVNDNQMTNVRLLCAKSRVAPIKQMTMPRLELCGALLLSRLYNEVKNSLRDIRQFKITFWCDSTIVLHWIRMSPHSLNVFVSHRVSEIQEHTNPGDWRYVRTNDNPADAISRGQEPRAFLRNEVWFTGPKWLIKDEDRWPNENPHLIEVPEAKGKVCMATIVQEPAIFDRYSSYSKLIRIVAYCLRFRLANRCTGELSIAEIDAAEIRIIKIVQAARFSDEIHKITNALSNPKGKLDKLSPMLDKDGLLRVGGRLQASDTTYDKKHPILLPSRHKITDSIIREVHNRYHHTGIQSTLHHIRQKFWIVDGRNQVRKVIRTCMRCFRFKPSIAEYKMGNLPSSRVNQTIPFANTGVDFCGPFYIKEKKFRNRTRIKVYICVFVCMAIKAVHFEVVSDMTSEGFLGALRRFIARRGVPENVWSDNGTNFVGANNELKTLYAYLNSDDHKSNIQRFATQHRIVWHFIPPMAPHFGGLWEATVKSYKHHFKRVIGDSLFTFEELNTFTIEIEGILNSRPIVALSSDPNDSLALTPAHYLIGKPLTALPQGNLSSIPGNRLSTWQHITKVRQDFWSRWYLEYLNELQVRSKWVKDGSTIQNGSVVLLKEKNLPPTQWALGKIVETHPGEDGIIRTVVVKTANGLLKRGAKYLCPLPIDT